MTYQPVCTLYSRRNTPQEAHRRVRVIVGRYRSIYRFQRTLIEENVRKFFRSRSDSPGPRPASTTAWVRAHNGTALASNFFPCAVNSSRRARRSSRFGVILISLRRRSGFSAAVKVVRSIASNDATAPIVGPSGRFKDIISENCQLVRPSGRNALSNRCARARAARWT